MQGDAPSFRPAAFIGFEIPLSELLERCVGLGRALVAKNLPKLVFRRALAQLRAWPEHLRTLQPLFGAVLLARVFVPVAPSKFWSFYRFSPPNRSGDGLSAYFPQ